MVQPDPGHYERAQNALALISQTFADYGPTDDPEGGKANTLMILAMMAQARASLAMVDELRALREQRAAVEPVEPSVGPWPRLSQRSDYS